MVETYGQDEQRFYYINEATAGTTPVGAPGSPITVLSVPHVDIDPELDVGNLLVRGGGTYDVVSIKQGVRKPSLQA